MKPISKLYIILELWDGRVTKKHVYLSKAAFDKGLNLHSNLMFPEQSIECCSGSVSQFRKYNIK